MEKIHAIVHGQPPASDDDATRLQPDADPDATLPAPLDDAGGPAAAADPDATELRPQRAGTGTGTSSVSSPSTANVCFASFALAFMTTKLKSI